MHHGQMVHEVCMHVMASSMQLILYCTLMMQAREAVAVAISEGRITQLWTLGKNLTTYTPEATHFKVDPVLGVCFHLETNVTCLL